jgi:cell division protein FtsB
MRCIKTADPETSRPFSLEYQQKNRILKNMRAKQWQQGILIGILLLVAFWLVSLIWGLAGKAHIAVSEAHEVERQYEALEDRKTLLQANLAALATARGQDAAIRTAFGVARQGEEVIVVVPPELKAPTSPPSWWQRILSWF